MKSRITALLLLLALASMATAAPACASKAIATPAVSACVIESVQRATLSAEPAVVVHDLVAILPASVVLPLRASASPVPFANAAGVGLDRQPLPIVLRI